jgi:formate-nitrite transporter family protein
MTNQTKQLNLSPEAGPVTTSAEKKQVEERVAVGVTVVYEAIRREGEVELRRPAAALAWSALAAGLSMGFRFWPERCLPQATWVSLITKAGYSVGFLIVALGRQQLFTENTLTVVLPVLLHKDWNVLLRVALWGLVLSANLVGATYSHSSSPTPRSLISSFSQPCSGTFLAEFP